MYSSMFKFLLEMKSCRKSWPVVGTVTNWESQVMSYLDSAEIGDKESWLSLKSPKMIVRMTECESCPR